ncbi:MAG: undecaprenyl/decaprenyl-phosphate alpha-N-acetylglucosaminyl 1-phosphate transferase [Limnobacter sp.]|nr:undecaprenyl/decaprenyl-phosphate alpha-N-acetylglucosaminyl 1-phosphate transferase [Limnobacter sp.]
MFVSVLTCTSVTLAALLTLERGAPRLGLIDRPGGHKTHLSPTPVVGGIGIALGLWLAWLASPLIEPGFGLAGGAAALVVLGIVDDRHGVPARAKLLLQAAIVAAACLVDGAALRSLGALVPGIEAGIGLLALPLTVFALTGVINAVNMLDGLDGLAGKVLLVAFAWFAACGWLLGDVPAQATTLAIAAAITVFLLFNARLPGRTRARMFMGDTGSMLLGFLLGWMALDLTQRPDGLPPVTALWICALPVIDTAAVASRRMFMRRAPMSAGRDHLHHLLRDAGLSVVATACTEAALGALFGFVGVAGWLLGAPEWLMMVLFLFTALAYTLGFRVAWTKLAKRRDTESAAAAAASALTAAAAASACAAKARPDAAIEQAATVAGEQPA